MMYAKHIVTKKYILLQTSMKVQHEPEQLEIMHLFNSTKCYVFKCVWLNNIYFGLIS